MGRNDEGVRLFSAAPTDRARGNGHQLKCTKFHLNTNHFFTGRVVKQWYRLHREVVESPTVEIFTAQLGMVLSNLL